MPAPCRAAARTTTAGPARAAVTRRRRLGMLRPPAGSRPRARRAPSPCAVDPGPPWSFSSRTRLSSSGDAHPPGQKPTSQM